MVDMSTRWILSVNLTYNILLMCTNGSIIFDCYLLLGFCWIWILQLLRSLFLPISVRTTIIRQNFSLTWEIWWFGQRLIPELKSLGYSVLTHFFFNYYLYIGFALSSFKQCRTLICVGWFWMGFTRGDVHVLTIQFGFEWCICLLGGWRLPLESNTFKQCWWLFSLKWCYFLACYW